MKLIVIILPVFSLLLMERVFFDVYSASFFNAILIVFQCIHEGILKVDNTVPTLQYRFPLLSESRAFL